MRILCVGKLKENWQREACQEYIRRISRFEKTEICQVDDLPETDPRAMEKEGEGLLGHIRDGDWVVGLTLDGAADTSQGLSRKYGEWREAGKRVTFVIGGSLGLSEAVYRRMNAKISLSRLTFPHAMARIILLEQIYRCHMILTGSRYHK